MNVWTQHEKNKYGTYKLIDHGTKAIADIGMKHLLYPYFQDQKSQLELVKNKIK